MYIIKNLTVTEDIVCLTRSVSLCSQRERISVVENPGYGTSSHEDRVFRAYSSAFRTCTCTLFCKSSLKFTSSSPQPGSDTWLTCITLVEVVRKCCWHDVTLLCKERWHSWRHCCAHKSLLTSLKWKGIASSFCLQPERSEGLQL